jgi:hypothetical protein
MHSQSDRNIRIPLSHGPLEEALELQHVGETQADQARVERRPRGDRDERRGRDQPD